MIFSGAATIRILEEAAYNLDSSTGDTIPNIFRYKVNNEQCRIAFGPVKKPGTYYFYYLPYEVQEDWGFYGKDYLKPEKYPSGEWVNEE